MALVPLVVLAGLALALSAKHPAHAENEHIVTIFHDGQEQNIATDATTVGEALNRAGVTINQYDAVEPGKETKLTTPNYTINVYRARPITVVDGDRRFLIMSPYQSAKKIAETAGLATYNEDIFTLERIDNFLAEDSIGLKLTIKRSIPVNLVLYGQNVAIHTQSKTIAELIKEKHIVLGKDDGVAPAQDTPITANLTVDVYRNGVQTINEEQEITAPIKHIQDADHDVGYSQVQDPGAPGKKVVTYQIELKNGQEISRKEIQSVVTVQPKEQVIVVGVKHPGFSGSVQDAFAQLRVCEAGGSYQRNSGNGYYGAYQFNISTWAGYGGFVVPSDAPASVQDQKAFETYQRRGWAPWPACSHKLGLW